MKLITHALKRSTSVFFAAAIAISSCQDETSERLTLQDTADLTDEALTDAYFQDLDDMAGVAIEAPDDTQYSNGRTTGLIAISDHRFQCEGVLVDLVIAPNSTQEHPQGKLTIDFGVAGCTDLKGNVRTGKVMFTYSGKRFMPGSTVMTTTENYKINGITLEGTRTLTNLQTSTHDTPRFNAVLTGGKVTFADGTVATREANITWQWIREVNPLHDRLEVEMTSTASGTTRSGRVYEIALMEPLVYKRHCGIAVSGIKRYIIDGEKEISIDFGDGQCDRSFTVTKNGVTRDFNL